MCVCILVRVSLVPRKNLRLFPLWPDGVHHIFARQLERRRHYRIAAMVRTGSWNRGEDASWRPQHDMYATMFTGHAPFRTAIGECVACFLQLIASYTVITNSSSVSFSSIETRIHYNQLFTHGRIWWPPNLQQQIWRHRYRLQLTTWRCTALYYLSTLARKQMHASNIPSIGRICHSIDHKFCDISLPPACMRGMCLTLDFHMYRMHSSSCPRERTERFSCLMPATLDIFFAGF